MGLILLGTTDFEVPVAGVQYLSPHLCTHLYGVPRARKRRSITKVEIIQ